MKKSIAIGPAFVGEDHPPFIIAELSGNHNGSLERALSLVDEAAKAGVQAVKLQTYTPDTITLNLSRPEFIIQGDSLWAGRQLYELYADAHLPWEWHEPLFNRCRENGLIAFSTPFDETAVDFLETLHVPCYKIASPEIIDLPLIEKAAATGKPLIISTGGADLIEIEEAVQAARKAGCRDLILLKCTAAYPSDPSDMHLRTIPHLKDGFQTLVGLSDHTLGIGVPVASIALGCCMIEKHFTNSRLEGGVDSAFSLEPAEMKELVQETRRAWEALGSIHYGPLPAEKTTLSHRPSLYFMDDLKEGQAIEEQHIRSLRPDSGLPPKWAPALIGMRLTRPVQKGEPVTWNSFNREKENENV
ncbi:MAG: pseudaminic acid synthase [Parachlamydia sp.]|jgi:N-acetylneuraminate synthase|nr:pseudaminic acid synthase [Parachlamydia sp.]